MPVMIHRAITLIPLGFLGAACGLALLINPYGAALIAFLLRTATVPRPEIGEWTPLVLSSLPGLLYLALLVIGILALIGSARRREPSALLILGVTAMLPLISNRHYPLFAMAFVVLAGAHRRGRRGRDGGLAWPIARSSVARPGALSMHLLATPILIGLSLPRFGCIRRPSPSISTSRRAGVRAITQGRARIPREHGGPFRLGRVCDLATGARGEGLDRWPSRDGLHRRGLPAIAGPALQGSGAPGMPAQGVDGRLPISSWPPMDRRCSTGSPGTRGQAGALPGHRCCAIFAGEGGHRASSESSETAAARSSLGDDGAGMCFAEPSPAGRTSEGQ